MEPTLLQRYKPHFWLIFHCQNLDHLKKHPLGPISVPHRPIFVPPVLLLQDIVDLWVMGIYGDLFRRIYL